MNRIRRETSLSYILSKVIKLPALVTMWGSLGREMLNDRVGEPNLVEW